MKNAFPRRPWPGWLVLWICTVLATAPAPAAAGYDPNLLVNGSFEDGFTGWQGFLRWGFQNVTFLTADDTVAHAGGVSAKVAATALPETAGWRQTIAVLPHTRYRLTGWIKTDALRSGAVGGGASLAVLAPGIDFLAVSDPVLGTVDWTRAETVFDSLDFSSLEIHAAIGVLGRTLGTAWFDEIELHEVVPRPFVIGPADTLATNGVNANLSVDFISPIPVEIQWLKNGEPLPGATNQVLDLGTATPALSGNYSVTARNAGGLSTGRTALLEVVGGPGNHAPTPAALEPGALDYQRHAVPLTVTLTVTDADNSHLRGATIAFTDGYVPLEDVLAITDTATITGHFDFLRGCLTLTGRATVAEYQAAVRAVRYHNPRAIRTPGERTLALTLSDGVANSATVTRTLRVTAAPLPTRVVAWGNNDAGQTNVPANLADVVATAAGTNYTLALRADGTVISWGGDPAAAETRVPAGLGGVVALAANTRHNLALKSDGTVVAWGSVTGGSVVAPGDLTNIVALAAGRDHGLALRADGTVRAWGADGLVFPYFDADCNCTLLAVVASGQATPPAGSGFVALAGGDSHSLALAANGSVAGFGEIFYDIDIYGFRFFSDPAAPPGLPPVVQIAALGTTSKFLRPEGTIIFHGTDPGPAGGVSNIVALSPFAAITAGGSAVSWGGPGVAPQLSNVLQIASAQHAVAVLAVPPPPLVAQPQTVTGREDTDLVVTLASTDPNPAPNLRAAITAAPLNGTLFQFDHGSRGTPVTAAQTPVTDPQRRVLYAPAAQGNGIPFDGFLFTVTDGPRTSAPARVTIHVTAVNDAPVAGYGTSLALNGSSSAELTRPPFASATSDFTYELWVRPAVLNDGFFHGILGRHLAGGTTNRSPSLWQGPDRGALHLDSLAVDGRRFGLLLPGFFSEAGAWIHVALVKQGTTYRVYRNGALFARGPAPAAVRIVPHGFSLGRVDNHFRGQLDEIRIWQTARTAAEIRADAARPLTGGEPGLRSAWGCNEGAGRMLRDLSPFRNHARFHGGAAFSPLTPPLRWETPRSTSITGWLPAADLEGNPLRFTLVTQPGCGTLALWPNGNFTYTPRADFSGTDAFLYRVNDGRLDSAPATATLVVRPPPPPPLRSLRAR